MRQTSNQFNLPGESFSGKFYRIFKDHFIVPKVSKKQFFVADVLKITFF